MISQVFPAEQLKKVLIPRENWCPVATADEREFWEALPATPRKAHIRRAEQALGYAWPPLPATLFLEFMRNGNRSRYEKKSFERRDALCGLVLAECMEGRNRFVDDIVNGIWAICEESFWGVPAHVRVQKAGDGLPDIEEPVVPLFVGETAGLLAWTLYLLGSRLDVVSPLIRHRVHLEMERRVLTPCLERDDFWWMGFRGRRVNNWNPWINSNWLTAALLLEDDDGRRLAAVAKSIKSLDNFIDPYPADGGCDEGPSYWGRAGASLFDCLELLHSATGGAIDVYREPLIRKIGQYIYKVQIGGEYFVNFADAPARMMPSASLLFRYGGRIGDPQMMALGAWAAREQRVAEQGGGMNGRMGSIGRRLAALPTTEDLWAAKPAQPLPRDVWFPNIQVMAARERQGDSGGLYLAAKGGHNAESHNHNDVGNFIVYTDGKPLIIDAGVETYNAKTFSSRRYEIWTMQSAFHNLPTVNRVMQHPGREFAARDVEYTADDPSARLTLDIAGAYPPEAGIGKWIRRLEIKRGQYVEVEDRFERIRDSGALTLSLLTPCLVRSDMPGTIMLDEAILDGERGSGTGRVDYEAEKLSLSVEELAMEDSKLKGIWGDRIRRIVLTAKHPMRKDAWTLRIFSAANRSETGSPRK